jgi:hypothetical protein
MVTLALERFSRYAEVQSFLDNSPDLPTQPLLGAVELAQSRLAVQQWLSSGGDRAIYLLNLSADEAYFYPPNPATLWERPLDGEGTERWLQATLKWLRDVFGSQGLWIEYRQAQEAVSPIIPPAVLAWLTEVTWLKHSGLKRQHFWAPLLGAYGQALRHLGLAVPNYRNKPSAKQIESYYQVTEDLEGAEGSIMAENLEELVKIPENPPRSSSKEDWDDYLGQTRELTMTNAQGLLTRWGFLDRALQVRLARDKNEVLEVEAKLVSSRQGLRARQGLAEPVMGVWPSEALSVIYKAKLVANLSGSSVNPDLGPPLRGVYQARNGTRIEVNNFHWRILGPSEAREASFGQPAQAGQVEPRLEGRGTVSLLQGLSTLAESEAVRALLTCFPYKLVKRSLAYHEAVKTENELASALSQPFELPEISEVAWPKARGYLFKEARLPENLVDSAHEERRIICNHLGLIIFNCVADSGMFLMFPRKIKEPGQLPFVEDPLPESQPWLLRGEGEPLYVTDHPLEALSLKSLYPDSPVLALGARTPADSLSPYLGERKAVVAVRPGYQGRQLARRLKEFNLEIRKVPQGRTWLEWRLKGCP